MNAEGECVKDDGTITPPKVCPEGTTMDADGDCDELATDVDDTDTGDDQVLGTQVTNTGSDDTPSVGSDDQVAPAAAPEGAALALTGGNVIPLLLVAFVLLISGLVLLRSRGHN